ncbi:MAG TPA: ParB N-terminal domain-containing protein, partial [Tianweitania sediminis]|nr:ParB N-terminal domain-containing protein [Tianweitania sediminis]
MASKSLKTDDLLLDLNNPRISKSSSQREALQKIIEDQDVKLAALAQSIVQDGLNPMDRLLIVKAEEDAGKFVVIEGNRRLAALKILTNPAVLSGLEVRPPLQRRLEALSAEFDQAPLRTVDCFELPDRSAGAMWIKQRHTGENEGR